LEFEVPTVVKNSEFIGVIQYFNAILAEKKQLDVLLITQSKEEHNDLFIITKSTFQPLITFETFRNLIIHWTLINLQIKSQEATPKGYGVGLSAAGQPNIETGSSC